jgi:hypothetical protein
MDGRVLGWTDGQNYCFPEIKSFASLKSAGIVEM